MRSNSQGRRAGGARDSGLSDINGPHEINGYWWLKPHLLAAFFVAPLFLFVVLTYKGSTGISFLTPTYTLLALAFILVFAQSAYVTSKYVERQFFRRFELTKQRPSTLSMKPMMIRTGYLDFLAIASILAYIIWFRKLFMDPTMFIEILKTGRGLENGVRGTISTIPGITTLSQLGVVYVISYFGTTKIWRIKLPRRFRIYCITIVALAVMRMIAWTERLAVLEIVIPIAVIWFSFTVIQRKGAFVKLSLKLGPYLGLVGLFCFFAFTEYFRSWGSYYRFTTNQSFLSFIANRLFKYYSTSLNNGAGLLATSHWPDPSLTFLLSWFYNFPVIGSYFQDPATFNPTLQFLQHYGNPQFNTVAAIFGVFYDLGSIGGLIGAAIWGGIAGGLYQLFRFRRPTGVLLYPVFYVSILELLREMYLTETRAFPIILFSLIGALIFAVPKSVYRYDTKASRKRSPHQLRKKRFMPGDRLRLRGRFGEGKL